MKCTALLTAIVMVLLGCQRGQDRTHSGISVATPTPEPTPFVITSNTKWKTVDEFDYDWKSGRRVAHFKLELPHGYDDPGDFIRIHIQVKGQPEFVLDNEDGWVEYNSKKASKVYSDLQKQNLAASKYVLIIPVSRKDSVSPLIVLRSWGYASNAGRLHVIGFQPTGQPIVLFDHEFNLQDFRDLDGDGFPELVGFPCMSEAVEGEGSDMGTYVPYQVYKIPQPFSGPATLSISLTKKYTTQKYDGWAGPQCTDDFILVESKDKNKKPLVVTKEQANKLAHEAPNK